MTVKNALVGLVIGVVVGLFGVAGHAGFVDTPILGLVLVVVFVAAGAWFTIEWFELFGWLAYLIAVFAVTVFALLVPHTSDILIVPQKWAWASEAYLVLAPIAAIVPAIFVTWADKKKTK